MSRSACARYCYESCLLALSIDTPTRTPSLHIHFIFFFVMPDARASFVNLSCRVLRMELERLTPLRQLC